MGLLDPYAEIPKQAGGMAYARFEGVATTPTMTFVVAYNQWIRSSKEGWSSRTYGREATNAYAFVGRLSGMFGPFLIELAVRVHVQNALCTW